MIETVDSHPPCKIYDFEAEKARRRPSAIVTAPVVRESVSIRNLGRRFDVINRKAIPTAASLSPWSVYRISFDQISRRYLLKRKIGVELSQIGSFCDIVILFGNEILNVIGAPGENPTRPRVF